MLKILSQLEHKIGDKIYHFACDPNSPIAEAKEACFQFLKYLGQVEDAAKAKSAEEAPKSDVESVPEVEAPKEAQNVE